MKTKLQINKNLIKNKCYQHHSLQQEVIHKFFFIFIKTKLFQNNIFLILKIIILLHILDFGVFFKFNYGSKTISNTQ
jgi:hypothetical protein